MLSPPTDSPDDRYYLPTLGERLRFMGLRNVFWVPPILFLIWFGSAAMYGWSFLLQILWWWKPITIAFTLPLGAAIRAASQALARRSDPFCIHCGYSLLGRPHDPGTTFKCPECGADVDAVEWQDYARDPHWFIQRRKLNHPIAAPFEAGAIRDENPDGL